MSSLLYNDCFSFEQVGPAFRQCTSIGDLPLSWTSKIAIHRRAVLREFGLYVIVDCQSTLHFANIIWSLNVYSLLFHHSKNKHFYYFFRLYIIICEFIVKDSEKVFQLKVFWIKIQYLIWKCKWMLSPASKKLDTNIYGHMTSKQINSTQ